MRQATYTTTRLGVYTILFDKFASSDGKPPNFFMKAALGIYLICYFPSFYIYYIV